MDLLKGLKGETIEKFAELWTDKNFQELVKVLRINQENFGKLCLTRKTMEEIVLLQNYATAFALIIKTIENAYNKVNKGDK